MKNIISNILACLWFFGVLLGTLLSMMFAILMIFFSDIIGMLKSGFSTSTVGFAFLMSAGLIFELTGLIPAFRRCYYKLPWLYSLSMIMTMHLAILSMAEVILATGFSVISTPRHIGATIIMIVQIIVCRAIMCIYLKKNPMVLHKYSSIE